MPPPAGVWSELLMPREYPLAFFEMSYLLPHFLKEGRGKLAMYFTRVYNPVWTNPDGMSWIEMLTDEAKVERHACLTPIWSETAWFADFVLPMGHASERHDLMSQETHAARWIGFRQPVLRVMLERQGRTFDFTWQAHEAVGLGQVWEEDEFWIELSWRIDPDGSLGVRKYFESPYRPGQKLRAEEVYRWIFERSVPGLPDAAAREGLTPLAYMRKYGAFLVEDQVYRTHEQPLSAGELDGARVDPVTHVVVRDGQAVGLEVDGVARLGFPTPSRKLEFFSRTLKEWKWPAEAVPSYIRSHVHWSEIDRARGEMVLLPTFRLPTLIHTRSGNSKWLYEISHTNPLWLHPEDAARLGVTTGDLLRVTTAIGHFVDRAWVTEAIRPGVIACSHHLGRWRLHPDAGGRRCLAPYGRLKPVYSKTAMRGSSTLTRRRMLGTLGALGVAAASGVLAAPRPTRAQPLGLNESVDVAMKRVFAGRPIRDGESLIKLDIPLIAENGAVVPVSVRVDSPMTPTSYVKHIYIVADKNRIPVVTRVTLTPGAGQAFVGANIRLGETGPVHAIVEQSDGTLWRSTREVKVTVGGCGG